MPIDSNFIARYCNGRGELVFTSSKNHIYCWLKSDTGDKRQDTSIVPDGNVFTVSKSSALYVAAFNQVKRQETEKSGFTLLQTELNFAIEQKSGKIILHPCLRLNVVEIKILGSDSNRHPDILKFRLKLLQRMFAECTKLITSNKRDAFPIDGALEVTDVAKFRNILHSMYGASLTDDMFAKITSEGALTCSFDELETRFKEQHPKDFPLPHSIFSTEPLSYDLASLNTAQIAAQIVATDIHRDTRQAMVDELFVLLDSKIDIREPIYVNFDAIFEIVLPKKTRHGFERNDFVLIQESNGLYVMPVILHERFRFTQDRIAVERADRLSNLQIVLENSIDASGKIANINDFKNALAKYGAIPDQLPLYDGANPTSIAEAKAERNNYQGPSDINANNEVTEDLKRAAIKAFKKQINLLATGNRSGATEPLKLGKVGRVRDMKTGSRDRNFILHRMHALPGFTSSEDAVIVDPRDMFVIQRGTLERPYAGQTIPFAIMNNKIVICPNLYYATDIHKPRKNDPNIIPNALRKLLGAAVNHNLEILNAESVINILSELGMDKTKLQQVIANNQATRTYSDLEALTDKFRDLFARQSVLPTTDFKEIFAAAMGSDPAQQYKQSDLPESASRNFLPSTLKRSAPTTSSSSSSAAVHSKRPRASTASSSATTSRATTTSSSTTTARATTTSSSATTTRSTLPPEIPEFDDAFLEGLMEIWGDDQGLPNVDFDDVWPADDNSTMPNNSNTGSSSSAKKLRE